MFKLDWFRLRLGGICFIVSGLLFVLFPAIRPFFDETTMQGARLFASNQWVLAHSLGIEAFILLVLGFLGLFLRLRDTAAERWMLSCLVLCMVGVGLTLPFFGAEAFSLQVIGKAAVDQNNSALIPLINQVRFGPGIGFITAGLVLVAAATVVMSVGIWKS